MVALALAALGFCLGVVLVIWCVEVFVEAVARSAVALGLSGFLLAVVLAGVDVENAVLGVTAASVGLWDLALGTVFGEALFVLAVAAGLAGLVVPFRVDVPRRYLALLVLAPLPAFALSARGAIGPVAGAGLLALFVPLLALVYLQERRAGTAYLRSTEVEDAIDVGSDGCGSTTDRRDDPRAATSGGPPTVDPEEGGAVDVGRSTGSSGSAPDADGDPPVDAARSADPDLDRLVPDLDAVAGRVAVAVAAASIVGMTVGSLLTVLAAERLFVAAGLSGLAFGATILSFVASIEELALTVEPVRKGRPGIAVGNVVGSTVFYATANVGLVAMIHPVDTGGAVATIHWPFFGLVLLLVAGMLARGRVSRLGGAALLGCYVAYWAANVAF